MAAFIESLQTDNIQVATLVAAHNAAAAAASNANPNTAGNPDVYTKAYVKSFEEIFKVLNAKVP